MNKVVLLAPTPPPAGGIAGWTKRMLEAELKNEWKVSVVDEKLIGSRELFGNKVKRSFFTEIKRCFRIWANLISELKDSNTKVVHSCIPSTTLGMLREYVCCCLTKKYNKRFIIHFRCTVPNTTQSKLGKKILKKLCDKSDYIMLLNKQSGDFIEKITDTEFSIIPNFISESEIVDRHEIRTEIKTVLYVGGVIESKGAIDMLEVAKSFPSISFRFVGNAPDNIISYANDNNINNAFFVGVKPKEEVKKEMQDADVFMFLTYFYGEGFSNALAEAMAAGLPCIVTDWAANKDMIEDKGGVVVPVKTPELAKEALKDISDCKIRSMQSEFNINKVRNQYIDKVVLDKYVDVYEHLA